MGLDAHSDEQSALLEEFVLSRQQVLDRERDEPWSAAGPHSVSPFVPCAASRIPLMLHAVRLEPSDVLWDLGCGDGRVLHQAAAQYGCRCVGVDVDAACIKDARARAAEQGVTELCTFFACDFLRLPPGALLRGDLGDAGEPASRGVALPAPSVALIFVTGHALSRLSRWLHGEWLGAEGGLRLLTCVEALDRCVDFEAAGALFDEGAERPPWPVSSALEAHGLFAVPPRGTPVARWEAEGEARSPAPALTREQADGAEAALLRGLLSGAEMRALAALGQRMGAEQRAAAGSASGGAFAELGALDLFSAAFADGGAALLSAAEDSCHACAEHSVAHLHRGRGLQRELPALLERVLNRIRREDGARWRLLRGRVHGVRSAELHRYARGGSVSDPEHRDAGSLLTLSVLLAASPDLIGGELKLFSASEGGFVGVAGLEPGDGVLFPSEKRHNVTTLTRGERSSFVIELWAHPANEYNRHS